ncbi:hypothetical protein SK128_019042, partial [Halocaridina rubra]
LFDDGPSRYSKLCSNFRHVTVCQIGLSTFKGVPHTNAYDVTSYNFFLRPHSSVSHDPTFVCQTTSIEFLQKHNFDFNTWIYGGIPFMNSDDAEDLQRELVLIARGERVVTSSFEIRDQLSKVGSWAAFAEEGDSMEVDLQTDYTARFLLKIMLSQRYDDLWTEGDLDKILIKKMKPQERTKLQKEDPGFRNSIKKYIDSLLGFTLVFQEMAKHHKPLIFHNGLIDLMLLYKE